MKVIGYNYAAVHMMVHLLLAAVLYFAVQGFSIDYVKLAVVAVGTAIVDIDHVILWKEKGIRGYLQLRSVEEYGKPRRYMLHNLISIFALLGGSTLMVVNSYFLVGLFFAAALVHMLWDFLEDILVFRMGYGHWI